jgi:hypothetical protein
MGIQVPISSDNRPCSLGDDLTFPVILLIKSCGFQLGDSWEDFLLRLADSPRNQALGINAKGFFPRIVWKGRWKLDRGGLWPTMAKDPDTFEHLFIEPFLNPNRGDRVPTS